jgi:hypothetical protein
MNYTTLSLADLSTALEEAARLAQEVFGGLDGRQLNWRPDAVQWSVGQCFEHLILSNRLMRTAANEALEPARRPTFWQRMPGVPRVLGRLLIRSQAPESLRKFTAAPNAEPARSDIPADIIRQFIEQTQSDLTWIRGLDEARAARQVMTSPFMKLFVYSVLDGCRVIVAHDHRHIEQARRVTLASGFPARN